MAYFSLLYLGLFFLVFSHGSIAQGHHQPQPHSLQSECQLYRINAAEPSRRFQSEAGVTEIWDENDEQFQCVGVVAMRHTVQQRSLLLPQYVNGPKLTYIVQGNGVQGSLFPGCPDTYQSPSQSQYTHGQGTSQMEQHQRVRQLREGDVSVLPAGIAQWIYNDGQSPLVLVQIIHTSNPANQLDQNHRDFFLAGNPQQQVQRQRGLFSQKNKTQTGQQHSSSNIFSGMNEQIIAEAFNINTKLARKIRGEKDNRGIIVSVEQDLEILTPPRIPEEERYQREGELESRHGDRFNGVEETLCTVGLTQSINDPSQADIYNPKAGWLTTINSDNLRVLRYLRLSVQKGVLFSNAIMTPHWNINAHTICYITRGSSRVQIVNNNGEALFDGQVQKGQMLTIPQNFVAVSKASNDGLEWVSFKTSDYPKISQLAGSISAIKSMPEEVIAYAFQVSREDARWLKENRQEITLLSPGSRSRY